MPLALTTGMLILLSTAFAAETPGPAILPNSDNGSHRVEVGAQGFGVLTTTGGWLDDLDGDLDIPVAGLGIGGSWSPDPHFSVGASALLVPTFAPVAGVGSVSLRGDLFAHPNVHFGPWLVGGLAAGRGFGAAGLAVEAGWERLRFDTAMPLLGWVDGVWFTPDIAFVGTEAGVSFVIGERHALRVGLLSALPGVGWRSRIGSGFVEARVHSLGVVTCAEVGGGASF